MELVTVKLIIDIGLGLCNLAKGLFSSDRTKNIGNWMVDLGSLIEEVAADLEKKQYPYTACAKMQYMVSQFEDVVGNNTVAADQLRELSIMLHQAQNIERLFGEISSLDERDTKMNLIRLKETAGTLQAAGGILQKGL